MVRVRTPAERLAFRRAILVRAVAAGVSESVLVYRQLVRLVPSSCLLADRLEGMWEETFRFLLVPPPVLVARWSLLVEMAKTTPQVPLEEPSIFAAVQRLAVRRTRVLVGG